MEGSQLRAHAVEHESDRHYHQRRLVVLNAVTATSGFYVNPVARSTEPLVVQRTPDLVPAGGSVHVSRRFVGLHAGDHGDWNVWGRIEAGNGASRLDLHSLPNFIRLGSGRKLGEHRVVVDPEFAGIRAVDDSPSPYLLFVRAIDHAGVISAIGSSPESRGSAARRGE